MGKGFFFFFYQILYDAYFDSLAEGCIYVLSNELMLLVRYLAQSINFKRGQAIGRRGLKAFKISY